MGFRVNATDIELMHCICPTGGLTTFDADREYVLQMIVLQSDDECRRVRCGTGSVSLESSGARLIAHGLTVACEHLSGSSQWWMLTRLLSCTRIGKKYRVIGESVWNPCQHSVDQETTLTQMGVDGIFSFNSTPRAIARVRIGAFSKHGIAGLRPAEWFTTPNTSLCNLESNAYSEVYELGCALLWPSLYQFVGPEYDGVPTAMVETGACRPGLVAIETILRMMQICGIEYCPPDRCPVLQSDDEWERTVMLITVIVHALSEYGDDMLEDATPCEQLQNTGSIVRALSDALVKQYVVSGDCEDFTYATLQLVSQLSKMHRGGINRREAVAISCACSRPKAPEEMQQPATFAESVREKEWRENSSAHKTAAAFDSSDLDRMLDASAQEYMQPSRPFECAIIDELSSRTLRGLLAQCETCITKEAYVHALTLKLVTYTPDATAIAVRLFDAIAPTGSLTIEEVSQLLQMAPHEAIARTYRPDSQRVASTLLEGTALVSFEEGITSPALLTQANDACKNCKPMGVRRVSEVRKDLSRTCVIHVCVG
jgi:hypothetical protein